jgi:hypothetical protein
MNMGVDNLFADDLTNVPPSDVERAILNLAASGVEEKFDEKPPYDRVATTGNAETKSAGADGLITTTPAEQTRRTHDCLSVTYHV